MYLSPVFTTVPENVCVSVALGVAAVGGASLFESGVCVWSGVGAGVWVDGLWEEGVCCVAGGTSGDGVGCGVCCVGGVSGVGVGGVCWSLGVDVVGVSVGVDGVVCAWSALPQEIRPSTTASVARNERD